ncbi:MAG: ROK family protein [Acidimicrobiales bacterium]
MTELSLAVDIGGTKLAVGLVDRSGRLIRSQHRATPRTGDPERMWEELADLVDDERGHARRLGSAVVCGVGCGGPMSLQEGLVSPLNIPAWRTFPLRQRMAELTDLPAFLDNDAKALAVAEGWKGAARGRRDYLAMVVSTGVGGGIVLDGRLLDGRLGNAGHIGHVVVEPDGRPCVCGGRGCLEAEASGTAIAAITGSEPVDAPAEIVVRTGVMVGRAIASVANLLDLSLAVVAGSVALGFGAPFFNAAQQEIRARAGMAFSAGTVVVPAGLGAEGPLVGAAAIGWLGAGGRLGTGFEVRGGARFVTGGPNEGGP